MTLVINVNGVTITKYGSAAQRTVVDQARNVTVWVFFLIFTVDGKYLEELTIYSIIQFVGFIILLMGVFIYNEILVVRCCGLHTNTKIEQEKRRRQNFSFEAASDITYKS